MFTDIFMVFEDGLSKFMLATVKEGSNSTIHLPPYVSDGLFDSFDEETIPDDDIRNYNDVRKLSHVTDSESVTAGAFVNYDESDIMKPEEECVVLSVKYSTAHFSC